jgi:hypothetical protein
MFMFIVLLLPPLRVVVENMDRLDGLATAAAAAAAIEGTSLSSTSSCSGGVDSGKALAEPEVLGVSTSSVSSLSTTTASSVASTDESANDVPEGSVGADVLDLARNLGGSCPVFFQYCENTDRRETTLPCVDTDDTDVLSSSVALLYVDRLSIGGGGDDCDCERKLPLPP